MDDLLQSASKEVKEVLKDPRNQQVLAIVGAVYLLSKDNKERNAIIGGLAALALLPEQGKKGK